MLELAWLLFIQIIWPDESMKGLLLISPNAKEELYSKDNSRFGKVDVPSFPPLMSMGRGQYQIAVVVLLLKGN